MSSKINLQTCEYARKSSIFQDNQLIYVKSKHILDNKLYQKGASPGTAELLLLTVH